MKNEIYDQREQQIKKATEVYNQLVNESDNLTKDQINQIDDFNKNETSRINNNVNQNINNLATANDILEGRYKNELLGAQQDYSGINQSLSETGRIMAQNAMKNRQQTATESREKAYQEYLNQSEKAKLTGDSSIAQLALNTLKEKLNNMSTMNQYNNQLQMNMLDNNRNIENEYWNRQNQYNSVINDMNELKENKRQYDETMKYQQEQDKIENALKEKEYELALRNARTSSIKKSSSNYGTTLNDNSNGIINGTDTKNNVKESGGNGSFGSKESGKYYCNYTPLGLTDSGLKAFNKIAKKVDKNKYVSASDIESAIKNLPSNQQGIIISAFKEYGGRGGSR